MLLSDMEKIQSYLETDQHASTVWKNLADKEKSHVYTLIENALKL